MARLLLATCFLGLAAMSGCVPADHPIAYPMRVTVDRHLSGQAWALDIDSDGDDELVASHRDSGVRRDGLPGPSASLLHFDHDDSVLGQSNFPGRLLPPHSADVTSDGVPELLVPTLRGDSLFVSFVSGAGEKLGGILLATGRPRSEPDGELPWDPRVRAMRMVDVDGDGEDELVTILQTAFARLPRGIVVHDVRTGDREGAVIVGAPPIAHLWSDFDGDGHVEVLAASAPTKNGAVAGGLSDSLGHLMHFELAPQASMAWSRPSGDNVPRLALGQADDDEEPEVFFVRGNGELVIEVLEAPNWTVRRRRTFSEGGWQPVLVDLDRDLAPEVVTISLDRRELQMVDDDLERVVVRRSPLTLIPAGGATPWPDVDGDDIEELEYRLESGFVLMDPGLRVKALHADGRLTGVQRRGSERPSRLLIAREGGTDLAILSANPWYLALRYGVPAGSIASVAMLLLFGARLRRRRHSTALEHAMSETLVQHSGQVLLVVDGDRVHWSSHRLDSRPRIGSALESLSGELTALRSLCEDAMRGRPGRELRRTVPVPYEGGVSEREVVARPLDATSSGSRGCIVQEPLEGALDRLVQGDPWPLMAQRVAHRLKNSLSHMLLTTQRLQAEYHERAPAVAGRLDVYSDRIQQGIAQLRRETSNFLKLVDIDEPDLEPTDINELVEDFVHRTRRRIPPDVRLLEDLAPGLPLALVDREQIEEALENLVSNAVDVMGVGGTVTIATADGTGLELSDQTTNGDFIVIEVLDTGDGVSEALGERIFEPGVTQHADGTGLGLAIVRKIARDHGGDVTFESRDGVGSVFTLRLPIQGPSSANGRQGDPG